MPKRKITQVEFALGLGELGRVTTAKLRVAAYARVSTEKEEQEHSLEAQTDYFNSYIRSNPRWEFVGLYVDDGISGLSHQNRDGFNRMVADAVDGKIDLIVTKSLSRFARNTVDALTTIRKLKAVNVGIFFQKEDINTLDAKGEFLLTLMSSFAEEESRSISDNVTWGRRKQFADGFYIVPFAQFLGYDRGSEKGEFVINENEARVVRFIYMLAFEYYSPSNIARLLMDLNIPTPSGKKIWQTTTAESILSNEKYKGDALLQKKFTVDFRTKKQKRNEGEVPQYYVENSHPAIIEPEEWDRVQIELARRKTSGKATISNSPFSTKVFCGDCGSRYTPITWHSTDKYRRLIWQCINKFHNPVKCTTTHLTAEQLEQKFLEMFAIYFADRKATIDTLRYVQKTLTDTDFIDDDIEACEREMDILTEMIRQTVMLNASATVSEEEYRRRYNDLTDRFRAEEEKLKRLTAERKKRDTESIAIGGML